MGTYILRRLILMVPTLIGLTLMVFLLIAMSPGGIGAALNVSSGGQMDSGTSKAQQQAYLEDRYGLDDPVLIQYVRWLGRVSPVKFGQRDQIAPTGEVVRAPKELKTPPRYDVINDTLPEVEAPDPVVFDESMDQEAQTRAYRLASQHYTRLRADSIRTRTIYLETLGRALREIDQDKYVERTGTMKTDAPKRAVERALTESGMESEIRESLDNALSAYASAERARLELKAVFDAKPFREAGLPIIPGTLSVAAPDLGMSFSRGRPVTALIAEALPITLLLNFIAIPIIYIIAVPSGMLAATHRGSWFDVLSGGLYVALWSVPIVWACVLMLGYLANNQSGLGAFPVTGLHSIEAQDMTWLPSFSDGHFVRGYILDTLWHLCLPVAALVYTGFAVLSKQTRAAMLDNFNADYVRTAKAKGVPSRDIVLRHVFRNSLLPIITMFVSIFPAMLAGSVVVEKVFSVPGMGSLVIEAIFLRDREVLLANAFIIGVVNMLALLLADVLYALADPRISYD